MVVMHALLRDFFSAPGVFQPRQSWPYAKCEFLFNKSHIHDSGIFGLLHFKKQGAHTGRTCQQLKIKLA